MDFRIYYEDRPPYDGSPWDAPALGVLVIVENDPDHGRRLVAGHDYYVWVRGCWVGVDLFGMFDYLVQPGQKRVLIGRTVSNDMFREAYIMADTDPDFPKRTAYGVFERKL